ncbi:amino acid adenylation domain-containing protein [Streptomonospora algeriensis]|uniref:Amino acid adenylation domain-containing protein n=1 Tax=Streptomonospora algeriensis TaxID=995084 RepID=A0ABW3B9L5_9ACTN
MRQDGDDGRARTLQEAFYRQAALHPDREALRPVDGPRLTYSGLLGRAAGLAGALARHGVRRGDRVAVLGGREADTVVALLGVLHLGAAYCVVDSALPAPRRELISADLEADALVVADPGMPPPRSGSCPVLRLDEADVPPPGPPVPPPAPSRPDDLAYVMYTSGSTGRPKGVLVEHASALNMLESYEALVPSGPVFAGSLVASPAFDVSVWEIFSVLTRGGTLHVPASASLRGGEEMWRFLTEQGIDSAYIPPGLVAPVVEAAERCGGSGPGRVLVGVEPVSQGILDRFRIACPGLRIVNGYGPTETTVTATLHLFDRVEDPARRTPIGRPVAGSTVDLLDERLRPVEPGRIGEIAVSGSCLARGYWRNEAEEAERFVVLDSRRVYRTGDYGRLLPSGELEFVERRDDQIKIHGFRVELGEIEAVLTREPGVRRCIVRAVGDPGALRVAAAVEAPGGASPTALRDYAAAELPAYMVPSRIVVAEAFPLTGNGKVDVEALFSTERARPSDGPPYTAPRTREERLLCRVWAEVLGLDEVGVDDDFHWLGGASLDAVRVSTRARDEGVAATAAEVLSARTVRALAALETTPRKAERSALPGQHPASRAQQGLWAWRELHPGSSATTVVHALRLPDTLTRHRLREALTKVASWHEALRTTFRQTSQGVVVQDVSAAAPVDLPVSWVEDEAEADARIREALGRRLDAGSRLWEAELLQGPGFGVLVFTADHLVFDGESAAILEQDLVRALEEPSGRTKRESVPGTASAGVLADPDSERARQLGEYWRHKLEDLPDLPSLPPPLERTAADTQRSRVTRTLSQGARARELAREARTTPFVFVLTVFKAFLRHRQGRPDNTVSVAVSRRHDLGCTDAIGHMVNLLPVRDRVEQGNEGQSLRSYLAEMAACFSEAMDHRDLPFEDMAPESARGTGQGVPAPARVVLAQRVQGSPSASETSPEPDIRRWEGIPSNSHYELALFLDEGDGTLPPRVEWVGTGFLAGALESWAEAFDAYWAAAVAAPDTPLENLPRLTRSEEELIEATALPAAAAPQESITDLFADQVSVRPTAVALQDGPRRISYRELDERAAGIAAALAQAGVDGRCPVAVVLDKCADLPAALLAVLRTGAPYLPMEPEHARTRLPRLLGRAAVSACVTRSDIAADLGMPADLPRVLVDDPALQGLPKSEESSAVAGPEDLAYVMPTSGTSGEPKLVGVPHRGVVRLVRNSRTLPLDDTDTTMLVSNVSFDAATFEVWGALANGGRLVVPAPQELAAPQQLCEAVERHGVTAGFFTVSLFERLLEADPDRLSGMRHLLVGGEAVPPSLLVRASTHVPQDSLVNGYGPTENTTFSCCYRIDRDLSTLRSAPIGRPVDGSGAVVVDADLKPVPVGVPGELAVTGHGLALGYLDDSRLTARRFVGLDSLGGVRAYLTGDRARLLPDGSFEYLERLDRQVKVRGFRVEPGEVETELESHPSVRRAAAYAERIAGTSTLRAAVEATGVDGHELRQWLQERVPGYLVPDRVHVFGAFPATENGKLDYGALQRASREQPAVPVGPRGDNPEMDVLIGIWQELLGEEGITPNSDFFRLGANSITVLALSSRLQQELGWEVPAHVVYSARTVRAIADYARSSPEEERAVRENQKNQVLKRAGKIRQATRRNRQ